MSSLVPNRNPVYGSPIERTTNDPVDPQYGAPIRSADDPARYTTRRPGYSKYENRATQRIQQQYRPVQPAQMAEPPWMEEMRQMMAGGGGGGGDVGGYAPPAAPEIDQDLEQRALQAALDRIGAEYGIRIAEPQNALSSLGGQYQMAMQQNQRQFGDAGRQQNSAMAGRGLLRSGVRNTEMQRAFDPIESQRREIQNTMAYGEGVEEKDYGTQALSLQAAIEQLTAAQGNAELERRLEAERSGLSHSLATANPGG